MKRITYAGMTFVTTDGIADQVVALAVDLANSSRAASVTVPGITQDGERSTFTLVLGPASQAVVDEVTEPFTLTDPEAERLLHARRAEIAERDDS